MGETAQSTFMSETLALGAEGTHQLPISSVCNAHCIFCSNDMNPFAIHRLGFRPLEDVRRGIEWLDAQAEEIRLGDSLPGRISEGEALLHPDLLTILQLVRERAPASVIQISTNGSVLSERFIEQLLPFRPMKFTISYHSDDATNWQRIFKRGARQQAVARGSFSLLLARGFEVEASLVPLPALVGYADIERTLIALKSWTNKVLVWAPGYTRMASAEQRAVLASDPHELSAFMAAMRDKLDMDLELKPDMVGALPFAPFTVMRKTVYARKWRVLWLFSEAAYVRASAILDEWRGFFANQHHAVLVENQTYGGNIVCSGLLMVNDFRIALKHAIEEYGDGAASLAIVPRNAFDCHGDDLRGENYRRLQEEFGLPVWRETC